MMLQQITAIVAVVGLFSALYYVTYYQDKKAKAN